MWCCVGHFIDKIPVLGRGHYEQIPDAVAELSHQHAGSVTVVVDLKVRSLANRYDSNEKGGVMRVREGLAHVCMFVKVGHDSTRVHMSKEYSRYISASGTLQCNAIRSRARLPDRFGLRVFR